MTRKTVAHKAFGKTLAVSDEPEVLVIVSDFMTEANKISLITSKDVLVEFDTVNGLEILAGESYYDDDITITDRIAFVNKNPGEKPRVRGIIWGN